MKKREKKSLAKRNVGPLGVSIFVLVLALVAGGGYLAWQSPGVRGWYYARQVCCSREPGPAMKQLVLMGPRCIPYVARQFPESSGNARRLLLDVLWQAKDPSASVATPANLKALDKPTLKAYADDAMRMAGMSLSDESVEVRISALRVFHEWGKGRSDKVRLIAPLRKDPVDRVSEVACGTLAIVTGKDLDPRVELWDKYLADHPELLEPEK